MVRINKFLAMSGVCSRREADKKIEFGRVKVNGQVVNEMGLQIDENKDIVEVNGKRINIEKKKLYLVMNKPEGYITTSKEQCDRPYIMQLVNEKERVFPVGRLDMDTEGLIILTNDGDFSNEITHPSKKIDKTYIARVRGSITDDKIQKLREGVEIDDYTTAPAKAKQVEKQTIEITIHEGKKRQVKRMCEAVGLRVIKLKRVRIGNLTIDGIETGKYKVMTEKEIRSKIFG